VQAPPPLTVTKGGGDGAVGVGGFFFCGQEQGGARGGAAFVFIGKGGRGEFFCWVLVP